MTLDTLTRASAEHKHQQLKNSLAQSRAEVRQRFRQDAELFRSLPTSPIATASASGPSGGALPGAEDLVRAERLAQCCKRVHLWRRQTVNPLLQFKQQQLQPHFTLSGKGGAGLKAADLRLHVSLLLTMIVDIYEQKMASEVGGIGAAVAFSGGISESFPEFVVKFVTAKSSSRRAATEQIHALIATISQPSSHARVRVFASLCGLKPDVFHPPETIQAFLHIVESVHRHKVSHAGNVRLEDTTVADVVFYNIGIPQSIVKAVISELFLEEYHWNFRFWHAHFHELKLDYQWPPRAREELEEKALGLATATRNGALSGARKIDADLFLELLLETWTQRAKELADRLERATDDEERRSAAVLQHKQAIQDARGVVKPVSPAELQLFEELVDEYWNAEVPWTSTKLQRRLAHVTKSRPLNELAALYDEHLRSLDDSKRVWDWSKWQWDVDWEWGALLVRDDATEPTST
ncbi:hypothetical protein P43SY_007923 [Pythium insidiosum]|uniref:Uncharacterized protein n=1 Tax=Pythium insidiosum TaxID=114742 RepID=A0AAD5Q8R7_PYTIN|nr:hypothetical protein P43SY_007923 [Pythium insidiosum]